MSLFQKTTLTGWGKTSLNTVPLARPERLADVPDIVSQTSQRLITHGLGRSYGDNAVPVADGQAISLARLDRFLSFEPQSGLLVAEAGVTFAEIIRLFLPRGWILPVSPGTAHVTLGGAIANDVHGKNHLHAGSLGRHVLWIDLMLPHGEVRHISRESFPQLFSATLGGIGLTGVILRAALQLMPVAGQAMQVTQHRVEDLDDMLAAFAAQSTENPYAVAWIDAMAKGGSLGRGIFEQARSVHAPKIKNTPKAARDFPCTLPNFALNALSIKAFNTLRYHLVGHGNPHTHTVTVNDFFYPLDSIHHWNKMYGKRGFHQFQAVLPYQAAPEGLRVLLETIAQSRRASFLAVLKRLGAEGEGYLSFPMDGYTLALDFPNTADSPALIRRLINATMHYGGRVYLAKDSQMTGHDLATMYPRLGQYLDVLAEADPQQRMASLMAARLGLRSLSS